MRRSRSRWNTATHRSFSVRRFARSSSNATCSGQSSMQFIMSMPTSRKGGLQSAPPKKISADWRPSLLVEMCMTAISDTSRPRISKGVRLQSDSTTGKSVLLFPEAVVELNETAHEILTRCDGRTVSEIVQALAEEYDADLAALA